MLNIQIIKTQIFFFFLIITANSLNIQASTSSNFYSAYCSHCRAYLPKNIQIKKSQLDHCEYFIYKAINKAELLVVQDNKRGSLINLEIGFSVGSLMDPPKYYGLAHYLQHMIFRGSKHFNKNQNIISFIQLNSGQFNAYTSLQRTSYFFQIDKKSFEHTASMMLDGLKYPLFLQQSAQKQISAIDQEYHLAKNNNEHKFFQLLTTNIFKQQFKRFPPGNKQILTSNGSVSYQTLSKQLHSFHNQYYNSNRMKAVLYLQKIDLDLIQSILRFFQKFTQQQNYSSTKNKEFNQSPIDLNTHNYFLVNHTAQRKHIIKGLIFPYEEINDQKVHLKDHPYLKLLNYILNTYFSKKIMKQFPQINNIAFQFDYFVGQKYPVIQFTINLLKEEQDEKYQIGKKLFSMIHFYLKSDFLIKKISMAYDFLKRQMKMQFDNKFYKGKDVIQYVNWLSAQMHNIDQDYQNLIRRSYQFSFINKPTFSQAQKFKFKIYYFQMKGNCISHQDQYSKTIFFGTAYKKIDFQVEEYSKQVTAIISQYQKEEFHPKQNCYENIYVQKYLQDQQTKKQITMKRNISGHKQMKQINLIKDQEKFVIKKAIKIFYIQNNNNSQSQSSQDENIAIIYSISHKQYKSPFKGEDLFINLLLNLIERKIYHQKMLANKVVVQIKIIRKLKHKMFVLKIVGPPKPSLKFLEVFIKTFKQELISQNQFQIEKKNFKARCKDYIYQSKPVEIAIQQFDRFSNPEANLHSCQQLLVLLQNYTYENFLLQRKRLQSKLKAKWVIITNKKDEDQVFELIQNSMILNQIEKYLQNYKQQTIMSNIIKQKNNGKAGEVVQRIQLPNVQTNIILAYYNLGQINLPNFLIAKIMAKILNEKLFNILRSQKQLAYQTFAQQYLISTGQIGIIMFIASNDKNADMIKKQIEILVQSCYQAYVSDQKVTIQKLESLKQSILKDLLRKKSNLIQNSDDYSYYLELCPNCLFQWKEMFQQQMQKITKQTMQESFWNIIKQKYNKLWILSQKKKNTQKYNHNNRE